MRRTPTHRRSAALLKSVLDGALDAVVGMDAQGVVVSWNPRAETIFGWAAAEAIGRTVAELIVPAEQREAHRQGLARFLATGEARIVGRRVELTALRRDGSRFPAELSVVAVDDEGRMVFTAFIADITERRDAERRLSESEEQYRMLFDTNPQPMWVFDEETLAFLAVNDAAVHHYGWSREEFLGMTILDVNPPAEEPRLREALARARAERRAVPFGTSGVWQHHRKDGALIDVDGAVSPIVLRGRLAWLTLATDVTEKRKLEAHLLQSSKMESVGRLAGGVAHDFNNILGVVTGYGDLLRKRLPPDPLLRKWADDILDAAEQAAALTRQLLAFSRRQVLQPTILDLNGVVAEMESMLQRLIGEDVELVTALDRELPPIRADVGQLQQVLMNLAVNARDAMPRGGRLVIATGAVAVAAGDPPAHPELGAGRYATLTVSDTGLGMSAEVRGRIFEPFFTTKPSGEGTGLGLSTVHGIVRQSGGHVFVRSEPGRGSTFTVYLPAVDKPTAAPSPRRTEELPPGNETILLVEDEPVLRQLIRTILEAQGYSVLLAPDGGSALRLSAGFADPIHLLVSDVVMPGLGGAELAGELAAQRPGMAVLFMSGYPGDTALLDGAIAGGASFLEKPFTPAVLTRKVRQTLDRRAESIPVSG